MTFELEPVADVTTLPALPKSTGVDVNSSTSFVEARGEKVRASMSGKERRDEPSLQLMRFRWLILQMDKSGHPQWKDEHGLVLEKVSQAELARRTRLTTSYLNSIKYPDRSRNTDIGAAKIAQLCRGVGLDVRYFYDEYVGERPYVIYLLDRKREQNQAEATEKAISDLRGEFLGAIEDLRSDMKRREQAHSDQVAALEKELADARAQLRAVGAGGRERVSRVTQPRAQVARKRR